MLFAPFEGLISSALGPEKTLWRLFPGRINWAEPYTFSYEFRTDIITSENGYEQRRAVRDLPRQEIEFSAIYHGRDKLRLDAFFATSLQNPTLMPEWSRFAVMVEAMEADQQSVPIRELPDENPETWLYPGAVVILVNGSQMETRFLDGATKENVSFRDSSRTRWPAGTRVYRALHGRLDMEPSAPRRTSQVSEMRVRFFVDPVALLPPVQAPGYPVTGFRYVLTEQHNWAEDVDFTAMFPRTQVDYGYGPIAERTPITFPSRTWKQVYLARSHDEVDRFVAHFYRMRGRAIEFLVPSNEQDIPYTAVGGNGRAILVDGAEFGYAYADSTVYRRVAFRLDDGSYRHYKVDFVQPLIDTDSTVIWVTEDINPADFTGRIIGLCWVFATRFASDRLDIEYQTNSVAQFAVTLQSTENNEI